MLCALKVSGQQRFAAGWTPAGMDMHLHAGGSASAHIAEKSGPGVNARQSQVWISDRNRVPFGSSVVFIYLNCYFVIQSDYVWKLIKCLLQN